MYLTDMIGAEIKDWIPEDEMLKDSKNIVVNAGTGTGKSTLIIEELLPQVQQALYLTPRTALNKDIYSRISRNSEFVFKNFRVLNYQKIEELIKTGYKKKLLTFIQCFCPLIIADEYHYFTQDSDFNPYTCLSFDFIKNCYGSKLFLSATGECMHSEVLQKELEIDEIIEYQQDYKHVDKLYFYQNRNKCKTDSERPDFARDKILELIGTEPECKIVYFVNSISCIEELYANDAVRSVADFYFSPSRLTTEKRREIFTEDAVHAIGDGMQSFDKRVLITTTALDVGVDLKDPQIKYLFIDVKDIGRAKQCLGRKRPVDDEDMCTVYVHDLQPWKLRSELNLLEQAIIKAEYEKLRLEAEEFDSESKLYETHLSDYAYNRDLEQYSCTYTDWIHSNGQTNFNHIKFVRLKEKFHMYSAIMKQGYKDAFCQETGLESSGYFSTRREVIQRDEEALNQFLDDNIGVELDKEAQLKLAELCCVPNSRGTGYVKQASKLEAFLLKKYNLILTVNRKKKVWQLRKEELDE